MIADPEIAMRAQQRWTSLPFPCLIKSWCRRAHIPLLHKKYFRGYSDISCDIHRIEAEFTIDEVEMEKKALVDIFGRWLMLSCLRMHNPILHRVSQLL